MNRYLRATKGLQSAAAQKKTEDLANEFLKKEGPELQKKLQEYASGRMSYIEEFWVSQTLAHVD